MTWERVVEEWVSVLRMSWPCIISIIFSWLQWLTQSLLWEEITSWCSGLGRKAKEKRLQNQGFNMGPAARIPSCRVPDPLPDWKPGTGNYLPFYPWEPFLTSPVSSGKIWDNQGANQGWSWDLRPNGCRGLAPSDRWDFSLMWNTSTSPSDSSSVDSVLFFFLLDLWQCLDTCLEAQAPGGQTSWLLTYILKNPLYSL